MDLGNAMPKGSMLIAISLVFLTLAVATLSQAQTPKPQQVRVALSTVTPHMTPLWVARDKRIFDKHGLHVDLVFVSGGALVTQMLAAGEIQVAATAPASLVNLIAAGERIALFVGISNTSPFALISHPTIKRAEDLRGKRIGTARFGGSSHLSALIALEHLGLNLKRDNITLLQTGLDAERIGALDRGAIDAAMLQRLASKIMLGKGYTALLNLNEARIPYQNTVLAAKRDFMTAQPKVVDNFTRSVVEGYAYVLSKENKQSVKEVIAKNLRLPGADAAEDFYLETQESLDRKPYPTIEGTRTVIRYVSEQNPKAASLKAEELIDSSWLKRLEDEGFFEKVYGGK